MENPCLSNHQRSKKNNICCDSHPRTPSTMPNHPALHLPERMASSMALSMTTSKRSAQSVTGIWAASRASKWKASWKDESQKGSHVSVCFRSLSIPYTYVYIYMCVNVCVYLCIDICIDLCIDLCMYVCMYVCMYYHMICIII